MAESINNFTTKQRESSTCAEYLYFFGLLCIAGCNPVISGLAPLVQYLTSLTLSLFPVSLSSTMRRGKLQGYIFYCICLSILVSSSAFQSDELLIEDEEFGLESRGSPDLVYSARSTPQASTHGRKRSSNSDSDSKVQFLLEHAFGDSDFSTAGTFTARLKTWNHGGQVVSSLLFLSSLSLFKLDGLFAQLIILYENRRSCNNASVVIRCQKLTTF